MIENIYHRYLDIPSPLAPGIDLFDRDYDPSVIGHISLKDTDVNPEIAEWLAKFNLTWALVEAFYTCPNDGKIHIHSDTDRLCDIAKINCTFGAPGGKIIWWKAEQPDKIQTIQTEFGENYLTIEEQYCKKLYEADTNTPSLVNVGIFHSTFNPTEEGRWTFCLPLVNATTRKRITWDEAITIFQNVIKN